MMLVQPSSIEESVHRARTESDQYGFRQRFREFTVDQLIAAFNREVGNFAWVSARAVTGLDCSSFTSKVGMAMGIKLKREGDSILPET